MKRNPFNLPYIIAVDFDGTLCEDRWPEIGAANLPVIADLIARRKAGARVILWTCRRGKLLENAVEWCNAHGLVFDSINDNIAEQKIIFRESARKIYANEYWDDKAVLVQCQTKEEI